MTEYPPAYEIVHGSAVAFGSVAVLIRGRSGSGKSTLALSLMQGGGTLVADDRTCLGSRRGRLLAWAPAQIIGRIEARGVGILTVPYATPTQIVLVVDLSRPSEDRLPPERHVTILGHAVPEIWGGGLAHLSLAVPHLLRAKGRPAC